MYGGYGTGEPAVPFAAARGGVGRHERPNRQNTARRVAIAIAESNAVSEPGVVDDKAARRGVAGQQHEVLIAAELDFGDHRATGIELALDQAQVGAEPSGEGDPSAAISGDAGPDNLLVIRIDA